MLKTTCIHSGQPFPPKAELFPWFALRIKANFEKTSAASLAAKGYDPFLPTYRKTSRWSDRRTCTDVPLFPGYLFCRFNPVVCVPVLSTPGVVGIVGCGNQAIPVSDQEIASVERALLGGVQAEPSDYLNQGQRVRVSYGPLAGLEGIIIDLKNKSHLVLQISLLRRSLSVEIDRKSLVPVG
jgi:transcription termination/antitermination protein NusG